MPKNPRYYWSKQRVLDIAKTCKNRREFYVTNSGAYYAAVNRYDCLKECLDLIGPRRNSAISYEECKEAASKYINVGDWYNQDPRTFNSSRRSHAHKHAETTAHMSKKQRIFPVINLDTGEIFSSISEAARAYKMNRQTLHYSLSNINNSKCRGYHWARLY